MNLSTLKIDLLKMLGVIYFVNDQGKSGVDHTLTCAELAEHPIFSEVSEELVDEWFDKDIQEAYELAKDFGRYRNLPDFFSYDQVFGDTFELQIEDRNFFYDLSEAQQLAIVELAFIVGEELYTMKYFKEMIIAEDWDEAVIALECANVLNDRPEIFTEITNRLKNA